MIGADTLDDQGRNPGFDDPAARLQPPPNIKIAISDDYFVCAKSLDPELGGSGSKTLLNISVPFVVLAETNTTMRMKCQS